MQVFTDTMGRVSALARGARKSQRRFSCLEPFHTLRLTLGSRTASDLFSLQEATLEQPRLSLASHLDALEAASRGLGWLRNSSQPRNPEPDLFRLTDLFLDELVRRPDGAAESLGVYGICLLGSLGWGLDFAACTSCGKKCPPDQSAFVHPSRGGLVCRSCGGGPLRVPPALRQYLVTTRVGAENRPPLSTPGDAQVVIDIVERALRSHTGVVPG